jgi:hypothetical protein
VVFPHLDASRPIGQFTWTVEGTREEDLGQDETGSRVEENIVGEEEPRAKYNNQ